MLHFSTTYSSPRPALRMSRTISHLALEERSSMSSAVWWTSSSRNLQSISDRQLKLSPWPTRDNRFQFAKNNLLAENRPLIMQLLYAPRELPAQTRRHRVPYHRVGVHDTRRIQAKEVRKGLHARCLADC